MTIKEKLQKRLVTYYSVQKYHALQVERLEEGIKKGNEEFKKTFNALVYQKIEENKTLKMKHELSAEMLETIIIDLEADIYGWNQEQK